jgi:hypothetical protein
MFQELRSPQLHSNPPRQPLPERLPHLRVVFGQVHRGLQKAQFAATVVPGALVAKGKHLFAAQQVGNAVGELDFAAHATGQVFKLTENAGLERLR